MNEPTAVMLAGQANALEKTSKTPEVQGRPSFLMGYTIRISPTIAGIHAAS
jgi:hypothetical protein